MIFPDGHISISDAYNHWLQALDRYNLARQEQFAKQQDRESFLVRIEVSPGMSCADLVAGPIDTLVVLDTGETLRVDNEVNRSVELPQFCIEAAGLEITGEWLEDMDSYVLTNACDHTEDHQIFWAPRKGDTIFFYIEPQHSVIDCRGYKACNELLSRGYDSEEHEAMEWLTEVNEGRPVRDYLASPDHIMRLVHYRDLLSYGIPKHLLGEPSPFEALSGKTVCYSEQDWLAYLAAEYEVDKVSVQKTVSAEFRSEQAARDFFESNPTETMRKADFQKRFCHDIGQRAALRVWEAIAKKYPHLSKPGRKS